MKRSFTSLSLALAALVALAAHGQNSFSNQGALAYVQRQDFAGLIRYASDWTRAQPESAVAWYYLGTAYFATGDAEKAIAPLRKASGLDPNFKPAWQGLGHANDKLGHFVEAANAFGHCLALTPTGVDYWNALTADLNAHQPQQARAILQREIQAPANSSDPNEWYNIALGFDAIGDGNDAKAAYQHALQLNAQIGPAWNNLGVIEQNSGNTDAALQDYRRAASLGEALGGSNAQNLQAGLAALSQRNQGSRQFSPQQVREFIRIGQAKSWETNHPGSLAQPYGKPF